MYNRGIDTLVQFANGHAKLQEKIFYCCRKHVAPHDVFCKGWTLNVLHHNRATLGPSQTLDNSGHAPDKQARLLSSLQDLVYVGTIRLPWIHLADKTLGRPHASTVLSRKANWRDDFSRPGFIVFFQHLKHAPTVVMPARAQKAVKLALEVALYVTCRIHGSHHNRTCGQVFDLNTSGNHLADGIFAQAIKLLVNLL